MSALTHDQIILEVSTRWFSQGVVVSASGEVDRLTAPVLGSTLSAVIDGGHRDVVLDLASVTFMDAAGLGVISAAATRIHADGGAFRIRSPEPMVRRLLDVTDLCALVGPAIGPSPEPALGSAQRSGDGSRAVVPPTQGSDSNPGVTLPAGIRLVDAALRLVTALTRETVRGADGVSVSLAREGQMTTIAASDETIAQMDRDQYATGEGPCLSAAADGSWFHVASVEDERRWPQFISRAMEGGIGSILSTPLVVAARPVGALNIYSRAARAFGPEDQKLAALLATQASGILAEAGFDGADEAVAARLLGALQARAVISQAQGVVMARQGVSAETAFASLRQSSKTAGVPIRQQAAEVVAGTVPHHPADEVPA